MNAHAVCVSFHMYCKCMHAGKHLPRMRVQLFLPRVNWTRHSVVAVIHSVRSPAVASHTLRTVISGHSKVLVEEDPKTRKRAQKVKNGLRRKRMTKKTDSRFAKLTNGSRQKEQGAR